MFDTISIGSGPAGLAAAIYGKRAGLSLLVLEKQFISGGQILNTYEVDNYLGLPQISGFDLGMKFREHADALGAEFVQAEVLKIEPKEGSYKILTQEKEYETKTIIFAAGAEHRKLDILGEERLCGKGVSYCATCDGAFFQDKVTAVIGGGDTALEDALFLARICKKVYLVHRRDAFRGAKILQERVKQTENIEILWNTQPKEIRGKEKTETILLYNEVEKVEKEIEVEGVFIAIGVKPNVKLAENLVCLDENGYIQAKEDTVTSRNGFFAAGDVRTKKLRQIMTATADGANAVQSVEAYLQRR